MARKPITIPTPAPKPPHRPNPAWFVLELNHTRASAMREIRRWRDGMTDDPLRAFSWGESTLQHAAEFKVATEIRGRVMSRANGFDVALVECHGDRSLAFQRVLMSIHNELVDDTIRNARGATGRSTSSLSNAAQDAEMVARARMIDTVKAQLTNLRAADAWDRLHPENPTVDADPTPEHVAAVSVE